MSALQTALLESLSPAQRDALTLAAQGALVSSPAGWKPDGVTSAIHGVSTRTVERMAEHGLLFFHPVEGRGTYVRRGRYELTELGRTAVQLLGLS